METIHLFVELLDQYFSNVCEVRTCIVWFVDSTCLNCCSMIQLDIVFHFNKVYAVLDEYILAGEIQETSKRVILERLKDLEKLE